MQVLVRRRATLIVALAACWTGLNAVKPPHIDDAAYAYAARQMAAQALDPYGFAILWYDVPEPGNEVLAPPVFPATWAVSLRLCGDRPWLCKLVLFGWPLLCSWALAALLRRFAPGIDAPVLVLTVLSPALLPSLNLMLDVPALALALASVELFLRACDRDSAAAAAVAGLLAGLATQTKYTALVAPLVIMLAGALYGRLRLAAGACLSAASVFVTWEFLMALLYGDAHFLLASRGQAPSLAQKFGLAGPLAGQLGGLLPAVTLMGLLALGSSRRVLLLWSFVVAFGFVAIGCWGSAEPLMPERPVTEDVVYGWFAAGAAITLAAVIRRLLRTDSLPQARRGTRFLCSWLLLELVGYFALTPFGAARRVLGVVVVLTLLTGRLAARSCTTPAQRRAVWAVATWGVLLGLGFAAVDLREAWVRAEGVGLAADWIRGQGGGRVWYTGHWGFQYAAEMAGMLPVIPAYEQVGGAIPLPPPSHLTPGDWVVVPAWQRVHCPAIDLDREPLEAACTIALRDVIPFRTVWGFYSGRAPLERDTGPRLEVTIYRVVAPFTPRLSAANPS
jgi:hypothetical protein